MHQEIAVCRDRRRTLRHRIVVYLFLAGLSAAPLAQADPIYITAGQIVVQPGLNGSGTMSLSGTGGFSLTGFLSGQGSVGPKALCYPCEPGTGILMSSSWIGLDLLGVVATFEGNTYDKVGGATSPNNLPIVLTAPAVTAPPLSAGSGTTLTAPFSFESTFEYGNDLFGPTTSAPVVGGGMATLTLIQVPSTSDVLSLWQYGGMRFDFSDASPAPIPEPSTLALLGGGAAMLAARVRRKKQNAQS